MHVYNIGEQLYTYIYVYIYSFGSNLYSLDQPANNGSVIVQIIGLSSLRGTNDSTVISTGVPCRILFHD